MRRWQHGTLTVDANTEAFSWDALGHNDGGVVDDVSTWQDAVKTLGDHGWELVHLQVRTSPFVVSNTYWFKRQLLA